MASESLKLSFAVIPSLQLCICIIVYSETLLHGRRQRGAGGVAPLDFQTWYKYSR